ncbi:hypothetical protein [Marinomonas posidonica]|uniref:Uncharacterized protein n=1 Tax=Marinomonas posidonica (strain CECT 7376 / NCIMB 14433 / IVIA-Po-181) TaxID=491952 RepID=F6CT76_MARPP|nr:hypothetical protein [Marinomonas posidonica]AEF56242.1 hypothetical protein Mar181_3219 [Marinomonas posidonica IVIA-Po-181]
MSRFKCSVINMAFLRLLNGRLILLILCLQLVIWYPFLFSAYDDWKREEKKLADAWLRWHKIQRQDDRLLAMPLSDLDWLSQTVINTRNRLVTGWRLEGVANMTQWQLVFERVQETLAVSVMEMDWQRQVDGRWQGAIELGVQLPAVNREFENWLPTPFRRPHFNARDWRLFSTMKSVDRRSALMQFRQKQYWLHEGSWLPEAGVSVLAVLADRVILVAKDGSQYTLLITTGRSENDSLLQEVAD